MATRYDSLARSITPGRRKPMRHSHVPEARLLGMATAADRSSARRGAERIPRWFWFIAWMLVGLGGALGLVSFALGILLLPAAAIGAGLLATSRVSRRWAAGSLSGAGIALLVVAYVQRDGPGTTCWRNATGGGCTEHLDPRPWLLAGVVLFLAGIVVRIATRSRLQRIAEGSEERPASS